MLEDTEVVEGQVAESTEEAAPAPAEELAGQGTDPIKSEPEVSQEESTKPQVNLDEEVVFEVAGKSYTMKQAQIVEALEKAHVLAEREKQLADREKSMNRDYTQKSQSIATFKKSIESTFGRMPEQEELKALGKIWNSYFKSPQVKQTIDGILSGRIDVGNGSGQGARDPYVQSLEQQIAELKEQVTGVASSFEERQQQAQAQEGQRILGTWAKARGIKIDDTLDARLAPCIEMVKRVNPDLPPEQILDEAYKHATIDQLKTNVAQQTLVSADKAKKQGVIRVTPKGGQKTDESKSYKEMLLESVS